MDEILLGDCLDVLKGIPDCSVDSVVTDPPYGLGPREPTVEEIILYLQGAELNTGGDFMGKNWSVPPVAVWREVFRVLKPGGYLLSFGGTRTWDLISIGIRAAGFENRDTIASEFGCPVLHWAHGQGFPKSHNVGKAIDEALGAERQVIGFKKGVGGENLNDIVRGAEVIRQTDEPGGRGVGAYGAGAKQIPVDVPVTAPATPEAACWEGWGTALKPAWEPVLVFRKPIEDTVAQNVLKYGTGGMNIDASRVKHSSPEDFERHKAMVDRLKEQGGSLGDSWKNSSDLSGASDVKTDGRWPSNVVLVHADGCVKVGTKVVRGSPPIPSGFDRFNASLHEAGYRPGAYQKGPHDLPPSRVDENGNETVEAWNCVEGCPVRALDEQTGTLTSGQVAEHHMRNSSSVPSKGGYHGNFGDVPLTGYGDSGGASRFFPQFETDKSGRWPSNVVLVHTDKCKKVGTKRFKGSATSKTFHEGYEGESTTGFLRGVSHPGNQHADADGLETADVWECFEGCPVKALDEQSGDRPGMPMTTNRKGDTESKWYQRYGADSAEQSPGYGDSGGASRFFPQFEGQEPPNAPFFYTGKATKREVTLDGQVASTHPTKKPLSLMTWLVRLVTPPKGVVLDPYCGSGTTCVAAAGLDMHFIGIEKDPEYHANAQKRVGLVVIKEQEIKGQEDAFDLAMGLDSD